MKKIIAETVGAVHTHTHTHGNLINNNKSIICYALGIIYENDR